MASYCHPREHSGVRSMRKPAGQSACRRKYANSFRFEFRCAHFRLSPAQAARTKVRSSRPRRNYLDEITLTLSLSLPKGEATWWARSHCSGWTRNAERLILRVEYNARYTPGYCLLLRDVSQTRDVAYLPANHRSETMYPSRHCAETRKCRPVSVSASSRRSEAANACPPAVLVSTTA